MEAVAEFFVQYARQFTLAALVGISLWSAKRAIVALRDWRKTVERLAESKKAKAHEKLTRILIQAVSGTPVIIAHAIPIFSIGFVAIILPAMTAGLALDAYSAGVKWKQTRSVAEEALELLRGVEDGDHISDETKLELQESVEQTRVRKLRDAVSKSSEGESFVFWLLILTMIAVFATCALAGILLFRVMPELLTALPMHFWMDTYLTRLTAIATKDEARQLVGLEQNVINEESLRKYLSTLRTLANKYDFTVSSTVSGWLAVADAKANASTLPVATQSASGAPSP